MLNITQRRELKKSEQKVKMVKQIDLSDFKQNRKDKGELHYFKGEIKTLISNLCEKHNDKVIEWNALESDDNALIQAILSTYEGTSKTPHESVKCRISRELERNGYGTHAQNKSKVFVSKDFGTLKIAFIRGTLQ